MSNRESDSPLSSKLTAFLIARDDDATTARSRDTEACPHHSIDHKSLRATDQLHEINVRAS